MAFNLITVINMTLSKMTLNQIPLTRRTHNILITVIKMTIGRMTLIGMTVHRMTLSRMIVEFGLMSNFLFC